ncbi:zinc ribbon domain-containing protein [Candidatus Sumerlaeota bacterium]|nr:zinc ribbon domain-containing protein [Candidatus Sumerlaeota bacterium]
MPIYEWQCKECGEVFEHFFRDNENINEINCPACKSRQLRRLVSSFGINTRQRVKGDYKPDKACEDFSCIPRRPTPFDKPYSPHKE